MAERTAPPAMRAQGAGAQRLFDVGAIAFDLDGTLLDTIHDLTAAVNALLGELGHPALPKDVVRALVGRGMRDLVSRALARVTGGVPEEVDAAALDDALARYGAHYAARLGRETLPFPGMLEALERLAAMRIPLAVITNKAARFVRPHLAQAGIEDYFALVIGGDDLPTRKPDAGPLLHAAAALGVPPSRLLMVGDSDNDVVAARAAGCPVIVVTYGYAGGAPVHGLGADGIVDSLTAVADRVRYAPSAGP